MNKLVFRLHILTKISELEQEIRNAVTLHDVFRLEGRIQMLEELFDDFNLEYDPEEIIEYHRNY